MVKAGLLWRSKGGAELWVGGQWDAFSGLDGRAQLIINCANEDFEWPEDVARHGCEADRGNPRPTAPAPYPSPR